MSRAKEPTLRYRIIDNELRKRPWVKTKTLQKIIQETLLEDVDLRTIQKDLIDMREDTRLGWYAPIAYNSTQKAYYYTDREYSISNFSLQSSEITALKFYASCLQLYSNSGLFKDFSSAIDKIVSGISLKQRLKQDTNPDLIIQTDTILYTAGSDLLELIVQAVDEKSNIGFLYEKFNSDGKKQKRQISPYLLKEYKNRWYVLGFSIKDEKIKTFALDRMTNLHLSEGIYLKTESFDPEKYFKHSFGITTDAAIETIILQFSKEQIPYVKSLPIHPTQIVIEETPIQLTVSIEVIPSYELYEYILGKMPEVKVVSPRSIANHIKGILKEGLRNNS